MSWDDEDVQAHVEELRQRPWYECDQGFLYIIGEDEVFGPDNETAERIIVAPHKGAHEENLGDTIKELSYVHFILRRFSPEGGFYHS